MPPPLTTPPAAEDTQPLTEGPSPNPLSVEIRRAAAECRATAAKDILGGGDGGGGGGGGGRAPIFFFFCATFELLLLLELLLELLLPVVLLVDEVSPVYVPWNIVDPITNPLGI